MLYQFIFLSRNIFIGKSYFSNSISVQRNQLSFTVERDFIFYFPTPFPERDIDNKAIKCVHIE